jgi:hypothetical protein
VAELDPVTQRFEADTKPYIASVEAAIGATDRFSKSVFNALVHVEALSAAILAIPDRTVHINVEEMQAAAAAAAGAGLGGAGDAAGMHAEAAAADDAARATEVLAAATDAERVSAADAAKTEYLLAMAERMRANTARDAAGAATASGTAAAGAAWGWGALNRDVTLWAGALGSTALIGSVKLWHIALDGVFEAAVALGSALAALSIGLYAMSGAAQDIYTRLKSIQTVNSALGSSIPPLTGKFDDLKRAMASQTVEAYGGALNLLGSNMTHISQIAREVVTGLDDWIAKLDIWKHSQASMGGILDHGVGFLHQFEQVVNNVGQAFVNLVRADPGTAHFLMDAVVGFSKLLQIVTSIPTPILTAVLALHSIDLWGGLAVTQIVRLGTSLMGTVTGVTRFAAGLGLLGDAGRAAIIPLNDLRTAEAGAALESSSLATRLAPLATNPFVWVAVAAAGIAYLVWQTNQASAAAKALTENLDKGVANAAPSQAIMLIANDVGTLNAKMTQTTRAATQSADAMGKNWREVSAVNTTMHQASNDTNMYRNEIVKLTGEQKNLFNETGRLIGQGYTYQQSLALMDLAGVQTGDSLATMRQKVDNLITGYQNLGVQGGLLGNAVNAVTFAAELQNSKIQQLTQSFSTFLGVVTGGESAFVTAEQGIYGMATAASGASAGLTVTNGKTSLATKATAGLGSAATSTAASIGGLSQNSLQLTNTWQTAITNGGNLVNSLLTQSAAAGMGAKGYNLVQGAAKDYMQQLLPMAQGNQMATAELYALAQVAGYQGPDSLKTITAWLGHTSNAAQDLQNKVTALTVASAGLTQDMENLANAISQNLNQAMAAGIAQANGGQAAFNNYANAAVHSRNNTNLMTSSATALARELVASTGDTGAAHRMFDTYSISLGLSKQQADWLWWSVTRAGSGVAGAGNDASNATGKMDGFARSEQNAADQADGLGNAIRNIPTQWTIGVAIQQSGSVGAIVASVGQRTAGATGMLVPGGYGGGDTFPAMLEPGETVVPKHLTSAVAPLMKAHGVPGFEGGGIIGSNGSYASLGGGGGSDRPIHIVLEMSGSKVAEVMVPYQTASAARYQVRNSGRATGQWGTGWKK